MTMTSWITTFSGRRSRRIYHRDAKAAEICSQIEETSLENCEDKPFGPPGEKGQELFIGDFRTFVGNGSGGLAFKAIYDFEAKKWGVRGNFYFVRNSDGLLTGGVGIEWDEEEGTSGSIFLTQGFNFGPSS